MPKVSLCAYCSTPFTPNRKTHRFCSSSCASNNTNALLREGPLYKLCPGCHRTFKSTIKSKVFCSVACKKGKHRFAPILCSWCGCTFIPRAKKQIACSTKCQGLLYRDEHHFGGHLRTAVGYNERTCWVCSKSNLKVMHVHHVVGHQTADEPLVALCAGCHWLVGQLGKRTFLDDAHKVADLLTLSRFQKGLEDKRTIVKD